MIWTIDRLARECLAACDNEPETLIRCRAGADWLRKQVKAARREAKLCPSLLDRAAVNQAADALQAIEARIRGRFSAGGLN